MRNILITLMLCALTLMASNVFAAKYDKSRRTERSGLSFYDGRPLYVGSFVRSENGTPQGSRYELFRVYTGDDLLDYGEHSSSYYSDCRYTDYYDENGVLSTRFFFLYVVDDNGEPLILGGDTTSGGNLSQQSFLRLALESMTFTVSSGDLGLNITDELFEMAKDIFGEFFPFFAGIFALAAGSKYFEHLAKTGVKKKKNSAIVPTRATQEYFTLEKEVDQFSLASPNANSNKDLESNERRRFLDRLAGNDVEETNSVRESYITGARWGREFSEELQESNRRLLNDFEALDDFYRERLIQEFERLSFTQEAGFLKSYRSYAYGVGDDHQNGNPFADESDFAQTPWGGSPFGGGDFEDANRLLDEEYYDSYDGAY